MKFTETQLEQIARYQESRGVTRSAAVKACKRSWAKGSEPSVRMVHMAAAAPALAPVTEEVELTTSAAEAREDAKASKKPVKKATPAKAEKEPQPEKRYTVGSTDTVKRGWLKEMIDWAGKQESVSVASIFRKFGGRTIDGHRVSELRCRRYVSYCVSHGILKLVKGGK